MHRCRPIASASATVARLISAIGSSLSLGAVMQHQNRIDDRSTAALPIGRSSVASLKKLCPTDRLRLRFVRLDHKARQTKTYFAVFGRLHPRRLFRCRPEQAPVPVPRSLRVNCRCPRRPICLPECFACSASTGRSEKKAMTDIEPKPFGGFTISHPTQKFDVTGQKLELTRRWLRDPISDDQQAFASAIHGRAVSEHEHAADGAEHQR